MQYSKCNAISKSVLFEAKVHGQVRLLAQLSGHRFEVVHTKYDEDDVRTKVIG